MEQMGEQHTCSCAQGCGVPHKAFAGVVLLVLRSHAVHAVDIAGQCAGIAGLRASDMARGGEGAEGTLRRL